MVDAKIFKSRNSLSFQSNVRRIRRIFTASVYSDRATCYGTENRFVTPIPTVLCRAGFIAADRRITGGVVRVQFQMWSTTRTHT